MKIRPRYFLIIIFISNFTEMVGQIQPSFGGGVIFYTLRSNTTSINSPLHLTPSKVHRTNVLLKADFEWPKQSILFLSSGIGYSGLNFSILNSNSSRISILAKTQHLHLNGMLNVRGKPIKIFRLNGTLGSGLGLNSNTLFNTRLEPDPDVSFPNPRLGLGWILIFFFEVNNLKFTFTLARELEKMTNDHFIKEMNWQGITANYAFEF